MKGREKVRIKPDQQTLEKAAQHVRYEWDQLNLTLRAQIDPTTPSGVGIFLQNVRIEVVLLHTRTLVYFLFGDWVKEDMAAVDYLEGPESAAWERDRSTLGKTLCPTFYPDRDKVHKLLAHLTYARERLDRRWSLATARSEISAGLLQFRGKLSPTRRAWFGNIGQ